MTEIWIKGLVGEDFDGVDSTRFTLQMVNLMSHYQDIYLQYRSGIVEKQIWEAERKILGANLFQPGFKNWWAESSQYFMNEFIQEVAEVAPVNMVEFKLRESNMAPPAGSISAK